MALTLMVLGCNGGPTDPGLDDGPLRIRPVLDTAIEPERLELDAIGVTILEIGDGSVVSDTVLSYFGDPETVLGWVLDLEDLPTRVRVEAEAWSGETRMFAGTLETDVEDASPSGPVIVHDLDMEFVGPGAEAVTIAVTPPGPMLTYGDTLRFQVTGRDANGDPVDDVLAFWSSSDPDLAPISNDALLQAPHERGSVRVEALTPKGLTDGADAEFQPPAATLVVVRGDGASGPVGSSVPLEVRVVGADGEGVAGVDVSFSAPEGASVGHDVVVSGANGSAETTGVLGWVAGDYTFTASAPDALPVAMVVTALAGPAEARSATITARPAEVPADDDTRSTLTVELFDAAGNPVSESGGEVVLFTTLGDLTSVTDNGDGTYTAYLSSAVAGTATVTGTLDDEPIDSSATVTFTETGGPTGPEVAFATITADPIEVPADNDTQSTLTVQLYDENEDPITESGGAVALFTTLGDLTSVTDNGNGTYTAYLSSANGGTASVTGTLDGEPIDDSAIVTFTEAGGPTDPEIASIEVTPGNAELSALGATRQFLAVARDEDGTEIEGVAFAWSIQDETVATIDAGTGEATAVGNGATIVTATADGVSGIATLTVAQAVASITLARECVGDLEVCEPLPSFGDQVRIVAETFDANGHPMADAEVSWSSGSPSVATVDDNGLVTSVGNGATTILAMADEASATMEVTVRQVAHTVAVEPSDLTLAVGEEEPPTGPARAIAVIPSEQQLTATARDANGNLIDDASFGWESLDTSVATVDANGLVRAVGTGTTKVRATTDGVIGEAQVTVE